MTTTDDARGFNADGFNGCYREAIEALQYLASHARPNGGNDRFNAEHLLQIADEMKRSRRPEPQTAPDEAGKLADRIETWMLDYANASEGAIFDLYPDDQPTVIAALRASPPPGYKMMPVEPTRAWVQALAESIQGQSSTPQCEPPNRAALDAARDRIAMVLSASPPAPAGTETPR